ncbi:glycosyltransferase family 4 protein [Lysobacter arvi]|uniref:Glycosyltransferase family 4 protein n=1 Tax=Lysobacter arvi TaxID=3038776 RepID=A0ABU1CFB1_9GAMM|nr:glycosyltransferase family 4 protein [Lysobacter arvi]MDR0183631.1 glycosyltransferase family 4 protein [Lysobacter arvi]
MRILIVLTYYAPYVSGVTEFARMVAEHLAKEHEVVVLATRHDPELATEEVINGVRVVRSEVLARLHKGMISTRFISDFRKLAQESDVVNLHLPMLEAGLLACLCDRRKLVVTYQCDMAVTGGLVDWLAIMSARASARVALKRAERVFVTTLDYAGTSHLASPVGGRLLEVRAPLKRPAREIDHGGEQAFKVSPEEPRIGFVGRFVEEKGLPVLLEAFSKLLAQYPKAKLVLVGQREGVAGGGVMDRIQSSIERLGSSVELRGKVSEAELWSIYESLDILALPSVNRYEAFGMVQIEAMMTGSLVVASDLPGVRTIARNTGCGTIAAIGDPESLHSALLEALVLRGQLTRAAVARRVLEVYPPLGSLQLQQKELERIANA